MTHQGPVARSQANGIGSKTATYKTSSTVKTPCIGNRSESRPPPGVSKRTLRRNCSDRSGPKRLRTPKGSALRTENKRARVQYGLDHRGKTIKDWWQYIVWTDEGHFNSRDLADRPEYERRTPGESDRFEHIQEVGALPLNATVHVAIAISYNGKGDIITYADPAEPATKQAYRPRGPRKSSVQSHQELQEAIQAWERPEQ